MAKSSMSHRQRVKLAIEHKITDRVPMDFACEPEIWNKLQKHFGTDDKFEILHKLDIDCRIVSYDFEVFCRPLGQEVRFGLSTWRKETPDGVQIDMWGASRKYVQNEFASYEELCDYPLADAKSVEDLKRYNWAQPDWWDFSELENVIEKINPDGQYHVRYRIGSIFETAWSLCGIDKMLMNLVLNPEIPGYIMDRINEVHIENLKRVMETAGDKIDMVYSYDDLAGQQNLLMSPEMWKSIVRPRQKKLFDVAKSFNKPIMYHCCGNISRLIDDLIDIGVDVLNPIQPLALEMDFEELKKTFGLRLTFHGGIDIQELLPHGTAEQVSEEVERAKRILGENGGYILSPAHHIQADTPIENILALYGLN